MLLRNDFVNAWVARGAVQDVALHDVRKQRAAARRAARLFAISFLALFLELMLIRWVPAVAKVVAYYANLMLISSFLGLGMGAMVARRGWRLFRWFPLLLAVTVGFLLLSSNVLLPGSLVELRFFSDVPGLVNYLVLVGIFVLNTALFVPLGEQVGQLFESLPPLRAYMWDLGGSFCGTVAFGVFSLLYFSPLLGILGVMLAYLVLTERPQRLPTLALFALTALGVSQATDPNTIWSPYQNFTIRESLGSPTVSEPPEGLREMQDPPFYMVSVNQNFYQATVRSTRADIPVRTNSSRCTAIWASSRTRSTGTRETCWSSARGADRMCKGLSWRVLRMWTLSTLTRSRSASRAALIQAACTTTSALRRTSTTHAPSSGKLNPAMTWW